MVDNYKLLDYNTVLRDHGLAMAEIVRIIDWNLEGVPTSHIKDKTYMFNDTQPIRKLKKIMKREVLLLDTLFMYDDVNRLDSELYN